MDKLMLLAYLNVLEFRSKLEETAEKLKVECYFTTQGEPLAQMIKNWQPFMILIDLTSRESEWLYKHISMIQLYKPGFPILVIVPDHEDRPRQRAESYGCNFILSKKEFVKKVPAMIEKILRKGM